MTTLAEAVTMRLRRAGLSASSPELVRIRDHNNARLAAQQFDIDAHERRGQAVRLERLRGSLHGPEAPR